MKPTSWILLAAAAAFALITAWFLIPEPTQSTESNAELMDAPPVQRPTPAPPLFPDPAPARTAAATEPDSASAKQASEADEKIAAILLDESIEHDAAVAKLFAILPSLPPDHQEETAHHIANLSSDESAAGWAKQIVENTLPEPASTVLFDELMNRPHEILMPALAEMGDRPNHPKAQDSVEVLEILFGPPEPAGKKWQVWIKEQIEAEEAMGR